MKNNKFLKTIIGLALLSMPIAACSGTSGGSNNSSGNNNVTPTPTAGPVDENTWNYYVKDFKFISANSSFTFSGTMNQSGGLKAMSYTVNAEYENGKTRAVSGGEVTYSKIDFSDVKNGAYRVDYYNTDGTISRSSYYTVADLASDLYLVSVDFKSFTYNDSEKCYFLASYTPAQQGAYELTNIKVSFIDNKLSGVSLSIPQIDSTVTTSFTKWGATTVNLPGNTDPGPGPGPIPLWGTTVPQVLWHSQRKK